MLPASIYTACDLRCRLSIRLGEQLRLGEQFRNCHCHLISWLLVDTVSFATPAARPLPVVRSLRSASPSSPRLPHNLLVMSYESLRADIDWVAARRWLYCVLDEGHAIRNPRSRVTQACKRVVAQHR